MTNASKNSARYGVLTGALVMAGMLIARLCEQGELFILVAIAFPVASGILAMAVSHCEGE